MHNVAFLALWIVVFTIPWENVVVIPGVGAVTRLLGLVAFAAGAATIVTEGRFRRPGALVLLALCFVLWTGLTLFWTIDYQTSQTRLETYAQLALFVWLVSELAITDARRRQLLQAFVLGSYVCALAIVSNYVSGAALEVGRYSATGANPNDLGAVLALTIPMAWLLANDRSARTWRRLANGSYIPAALAATLLTGSRGALIIACLALAVIPLTLSQLGPRSKLLVIVAGGATAAFALAIVPESTWVRLASTSDEITSGTFGNRSAIWQSGLDVFFEHPFTGVGAGAFGTAVAPTLGSARSAHNAFLAVGVEQGVVGLLLFSSLIVVAIVYSLRAPPSERRLALVLCALLIVMLLPGSRDDFKPTWFVLGLLGTAPARLMRPNRERVVERRVRPNAAGPHAPVIP
ncbi:MAG TPA: O-antigen ligase family protein [Gemmatimonadaceae bacterium]|jgi:O-antigen ligase|nr:O-antigen ligase family protein [Gemmatimonadaceae bacterium]